MNRKDCEGGLLTAIRGKRAALSPRQAAVADYILKNYQNMAYVTLAQLAKEAGSGHGTIVRLAESLGYPSFSAMQAALRAEIERAKPQRLAGFSPRSKHGTRVYDTVFELEDAIMREAHAMIDAEEFELAAALLAEAPSVVVAASGSNAFLGDYAAYFLSVLRGGVINVKVPDMAEIENICDRPAGSAALVFSLPRYPRAAQEITELLHSRGIKIIGISDALNSPIADRCDILFVVPQRYLSFIDPCAAVMSLVHSLLYGVYLKTRESGRARLDIFDRSLKNLFVRADVSAPD
ncbi:MurR/RpiR family transcriptional regulator [Cloacibacillus porcorum]|uniref:MurR/RpiR family transcriptional regulator n=1 Tax=Cloacibacillus porcorum TaxID=1197717 RepID=UPI002671B037|nr:MurR/RpiR family transcriptional regulator [Cloacibacillus porcorum]